MIRSRKEHYAVGARELHRLGHVTNFGILAAGRMMHSLRGVKMNTSLRKRYTPAARRMSGMEIWPTFEKPASEEHGEQTYAAGT